MHGAYGYAMPSVYGSRDWYNEPTTTGLWLYPQGGFITSGAGANGSSVHWPGPPTPSIPGMEMPAPDQRGASPRPRPIWRTPAIPPPAPRMQAPQARSRQRPDVWHRPRRSR